MSTKGIVYSALHVQILIIDLAIVLVGSGYNSLGKVLLQYVVLHPSLEDADLWGSFANGCHASGSLCICTILDWGIGKAPSSILSRKLGRAPAER